MTPEQAISIISSVLSQVTVNRDVHLKLIEAENIIKNIIMSKVEDDKK